MATNTARRRYNALNNEGGYGYNPYGEDAYYMRADALRIAAYGRTGCPVCHKTYAVNGDATAVLPHSCAAESDGASRALRGED